ncbi:hypothetical protein DFH09DRAFT_1401700 [Mycena vulgaris]|nr:hypothetical protein DFH09DRAFT_1401700 [Mycena vulgaris]
MSSYLASKQLVCALDPKLAETATQMETTLTRDGPKVAAILASLDLTALQAKAAERIGRRRHALPADAAPSRPPNSSSSRADPARWFPPLLRLAHTDFQDGNVLVASAADPTFVAVLDWEGARVLPAWDTRDGCHVAWMYWEWFPPEEKGALLRVYNIAPAPGGEGRHWRGLLAMLEARPALSCDHARLDRHFLDWFAAVEGKGWGAAEEAEPGGFRRLREFIQRPAAFASRGLQSVAEVESTTWPH